MTSRSPAARPTWVGLMGTGRPMVVARARVLRSSAQFNYVTVSGRYAYVAKSANATDCNSSADRIGCELQIYDVSNPAAPTFVGGTDSTGYNSGTGGGVAIGGGTGSQNNFNSVTVL